jgi:hypothetical protein
VQKTAEKQCCTDQWEEFKEGKEEKHLKKAGKIHVKFHNGK